MRWTAEKLEELRVLAPQGSVALAAHFGVTRQAVQSVGVRHGLAIGQNTRHPRSKDDELRARWAKLLPAKREAIRREMAVIMGSGLGGDLKSIESQGADRS